MSDTPVADVAIELLTELQVRVEAATVKMTEVIEELGVIRDALVAHRASHETVVPDAEPTV